MKALSNSSLFIYHDWVIFRQVRYSVPRTAFLVKRFPMHQMVLSATPHHTTNTDKNTPKEQISESTKTLP